jgi:hypothetical protein
VRVGGDVNRGRNTNKRSGVGTSFGLGPQPELYGNEYAAVVVACQCYHTYEYELLDSANRAGANGQPMVLIVPVGGKTTVLSTPRYNALAKVVEGLPQITVATRIGDISSYPTEPRKLDGTAVQPDEHVFVQRPTLRVSDVASVSFHLGTGSGVTNSMAMSTNVDFHASGGAVGISGGVNMGIAWGNSHSVTVGSDTNFDGHIPSLGDKQGTPEDEYETYAYSFSPYVYRQPYTHPTTGATMGYYVMDYAVSR